MADVKTFNEERRGWKVMKLKEHSGHPKYIGIVYPIEYMAAQWQYANVRIEASNDGYYPTGFHIFTNKADTIKWMRLIMYKHQLDKHIYAAVPVSYTGTLCTGQDAGGTEVEVALRVRFDTNYDEFTFSHDGCVTGFVGCKPHYV
jgi:hypothetical protein